jgi:CRP-like cAMP-binding protein
MFGWLKIRKPKLTGAADLALDGSATDRPAKAPPAEAAAPLSIADTLKPHPLLSLLPSGTIERLIANSAIAEYPKGTVVYREGEVGDAIFLIISGRCEVRRREAGGGERVEEVAGPGDTLGDRAFLNRDPHRHTAVVATHAVLLRIPAGELQGLFAKDPSIAGRFSRAVIDRPDTIRGDFYRQTGAVRRVVSILPLSTRVDAELVVSRLATALRRITRQGVLVVRLGNGAQSVAVADWPAMQSALGVEFCFARHLRTNDGGFDDLPLSVGSETRDAAAMASLISHCARHYPFVLLHLQPETPAPVMIQSVIESDLAFVLLQPSTQNHYDFELLMRELGDRARGACVHVKPIVCAEESMTAPDFHAALQRLGHPIHSIAHGFPLRGGSAALDLRFDLHINRLAREIGRCRIGLALSSGGAKGLAHIGVIQVLEENGIEIDCVAGASMGAYVGAIWAYGLDGQMLEKTAREVEGRWGLLQLFDPVLPPRRGFVRTRRTIARLRRSIGDAHFSELIRPLRVVATQLETLERVVFSSRRCRRAPSKRASPFPASACR